MDAKAIFKLNDGVILKSIGILLNWIKKTRSDKTKHKISSWRRKLICSEKNPTVLLRWRHSKIFELKMSRFRKEGKTYYKTTDDQQTSDHHHHQPTDPPTGLQPTHWPLTINHLPTDHIRTNPLTRNSQPTDRFSTNPPTNDPLATDSPTTDEIKQEIFKNTLNPCTCNYCILRLLLVIYQ